MRHQVLRLRGGAGSGDEEELELNVKHEMAKNIIEDILDGVAEVAMAKHIIEDILSKVMEACTEDLRGEGSFSQRNPLQGPGEDLNSSILLSSKFEWSPDLDEELFRAAIADNINQSREDEDLNYSEADLNS